MTADRPKRAVGIAVLPALMLLALSPQARSAGNRAAAFASWERHDGLSYAQAGETLDGAESVGTLGTIDCSDPAACIGASYTEKLPTDAFIMDPALNEASLSIAAWGESEQVIAWTGQGDYQADAEPTTLQAEMSREADSEGVIFGQEFASDPAQSFLSEGFDGDDGPLLRGYSPDRGARFVTAVGGSPIDDAKGDCITFKNSERKFAKLMNEERVAKDRGKLKLDPELGKVARKHTKEMIDKDLLHHTDQKDLLLWIVGWELLGENVGVGNTVDSLHEAFMDSDPHRKNILYKDFERFGVGTAKGNDRLWVTVVFQAGVDPGTTLNCS